MTTKIVRVGNTLTVEIPEEMAAMASLAPGQTVEWVPNEAGGLSLVGKTAATASARKRLSLDEVLEGIPENAKPEEVDWGSSRGMEVW